MVPFVCKTSPAHSPTSSLLRMLRAFRPSIFAIETRMIQFLCKFIVGAVCLEGETEFFFIDPGRHLFDSSLHANSSVSADE